MNRVIRKNAVSRKKKEVIRESEVNKITRYVKAKGLTKVEINKIKESLNKLNEDDDEFEHDDLAFVVGNEIYAGIDQTLDDIERYIADGYVTDQKVINFCKEVKEKCNNIRRYIENTYGEVYIKSGSRSSQEEYYFKK